MSYVIIYKFKIQGKNKDKIVSKRDLRFEEMEVREKLLDGSIRYTM